MIVPDARADDDAGGSDVGQISVWPVQSRSSEECWFPQKMNGSMGCVHDD